MKKLRPGEMVQIKTVEELLGVVNEESAMDIEIYKISSFKGHPFKVIDDDKMLELVESIKANGVLSPVLLRPCGNDLYEMVSGHRRLHAAKLAGLTAIPSIIREMTDDEATIAMVDANIQREELLPSEKAWAFKMKMQAMKNQGARSDLSSDPTSTQIGWKSETAVLIGEQVGESKNQVRRYIRLTELIPELLDLVDAKRLNFTVAVDVSYIDKEIQGWLNEYIHDNGPVKANQIAALREAIATGPMTQMKMIMILNDTQPGKKPSSKFTIPDKKLREYFPKEYSTDEMRSVIFALLDQWKNGGGSDEI
ncbi:MAG: ParB/RepB/Spo0J family partition protein [Eubacteriales bacterium]|nr:ParB/RepB/Spo0J family partition protein [Eubacteriales bacterium]